jgi:single-strand DNA-binding protein
MSDLNKIMLVGRLTKNPELRHTQNGMAVASFSIAVNRTYSQQGEKKEQVSFFNCVAWSKLGETISKYCFKGHRIGIEGKLQQRLWEAQDGSKRYAVEIIVDNMQFLESKKQEPEQSDFSSLGAKVKEAPKQSEINPFNEDDFPF